MVSDTFVLGRLTQCERTIWFKYDKNYLSIKKKKNLPWPGNPEAFLPLCSRQTFTPGWLCTFHLLDFSILRSCLVFLASKQNREPSEKFLSVEPHQLSSNQLINVHARMFTQTLNILQAPNLTSFSVVLPWCVSFGMVLVECESIWEYVIKVWFSSYPVSCVLNPVLTFSKQTVPVPLRPGISQFCTLVSSSMSVLVGYGQSN